MSSEIHSVRLADAAIVQIRGESFSVDTDLYPGAASRYRAAFRLICGTEVSTGALLCVVEVTLADNETGAVIYSFADRADTPAAAIALLDQFDPTAYLPTAQMTPHELAIMRNRYDERARRFRSEAVAFFS
jgi:hypothetical protein